MNKKIKKSKKISIGGQAVIEGVMMRGESSMAVAVRDSDGIIRVEKTRIKPLKDRPLIFRLPLVRGVFSFIDSIIGGTKVLMRSASVFGEDEPSKFEKWLSQKLNISAIGIISFFSMLLGLALAIFLFMFLPQAIRGFFEKIFNVPFSLWAKNFIEGGIKLLIFILYLLICGSFKDVKRTFMYHGAEHKTISCFEKGLPLTVENAKKCTRVHDRCGTTFIVFVILISILVFACFESLVGHSIDGGLRLLCKILLLPLVAGLSYELLKALSKTSSKFFYILKVPGLLLQRITTKEPDDSMLEVAITSFNAVLEMDTNPEIKEEKFVVAEKTVNVTNNVYNKLKEKGIDEKSDAEWIVALTLNISRNDVYSEKLVTPKNIDKINQLLKLRLTGKPLWYCIGNTEFFGYKIIVDENVLIPRPETELLCETAINSISDGNNVLDLCTGSGAIAIAINKKTKANVFASDISEKALAIAKQNSKINECNICFTQSDMFNNLEKNDFDLIISNPPYIKTNEIKNLQQEVKNFEPILALDGGEDGIKFYKIIAKEAKNYLKENGKIILEIGFDEATELRKVFCEYKNITILKDYENNDRILIAEK